jgi:D-tyrosyl-tRNA(Tyr) deacylase
VKAVVQRVTSASVAVDGRVVGEIGRGLLVFVGVERGDAAADVEYIAAKIRDLRVFPDPGDTSRHFDRSVADAGGSVLVVSQFTLAADCRKGRRPSFDAAAPPQLAAPLYEDVIRTLRQHGLSVATGEFQATMQVSLVNDGPVTLLLDSRRNVQADS